MKPLGQGHEQSTVGKRWRLYTLPCEPITAYMAQGRPNFYNISHYTKVIVQPRFEDFITFLYVFMNFVKVFVR